MRITRRRFFQGFPLAAVTAGLLVSGSKGGTTYVMDGSSPYEDFSSILTCLARIERVERYEHTNSTNGVPWKSCEIQADCTAYDGHGQEFPLHLYYCFNIEGKDEEERATQLLAMLQPGVILGVSGCVAFFEDDSTPTIYGARLRVPSPRAV